MRQILENNISIFIILDASSQLSIAKVAVRISKPRQIIAVFPSFSNLESWNFNVAVAES